MSAMILYLPLFRITKTAQTRILRLLGNVIKEAILCRDSGHYRIWKDKDGWDAGQVNNGTVHERLVPTLRDGRGVLFG